MPNVKTAISIREALFKEVDAMARQMGVPRSRLFVMIVEEFIRQDCNQQLLEQIDQAYGDEPHSTERDHPAKMKPRHRRLVDGQW